MSITERMMSLVGRGERQAEKRRQRRKASTVRDRDESLRERLEAGAERERQSGRMACGQTFREAAAALVAAESTGK